MDRLSNVAQERVLLQLSVKAASHDTRSAERASGVARSTAHEGWRDLLADATSEVFEIMVGTSLASVTEESFRVVADFTAMVGIAGGLCGVLGLRASSESATRMAAKMLGCDEVGLNENVQDAFGEICNMIAGNFKSKVAGMADRCALSVPTVISGKDYALYSLANGERFEVLFSFEGNPLSVTLDLHG
jgi:chemotaxis protein CheX